MDNFYILYTESCKKNKHSFIKIRADSDKEAREKISKLVQKKPILFNKRVYLLKSIHTGNITNPKIIWV